jgi:hypothetical protein
VAASDLAGDVRRALGELAAVGLIEGIEVRRLVTVPDDTMIASDGSRVVLPRRDACGPDADTSRWAGSITLRVGTKGDRLLSIRGDSEDTLATLRTLFAAWLAPSPLRASDHPALFSVWLTPPDRQPARRGGAPRTIPQLRAGSTVMARSRRPEDMLVALATALGGVHVQEHDNSRTWVGLRAFAHGHEVVLADIDRPEMVNDPWLAARGVEELATWELVVDPGGFVTLPPPLPDLRWSAVGRAEPPHEWRRLELAALVSMRPRERGTAESVAKFVKYRVDSDWFRIVTAAAAAGAIVHCTDHASTRRAILDRLA